MFSTCANPDCVTPFNCHQGQFFRFHNDHVDELADMKSHSVQHFWLCGKCCEEFMLEYVEGQGVVMLHRPEICGEFEPSRSIAASRV